MPRTSFYWLWDTSRARVRGQLWLVRFWSIDRLRCNNSWYLICQLGEEDHELSSKNSSYKRGNQDNTELRAVVPQMVFNNPNQQCYTQFFAGGRPPTGLRAGQNNLQNIRYICQIVNRQTYYGTMFDQGRGIAVFSAYSLTQANANFPNRQRPGQWTQTPGNCSLVTYKIRQQRSQVIDCTLKVNPQTDKGGWLPILGDTSQFVWLGFTGPKPWNLHPILDQNLWSQTWPKSQYLISDL